METWGGVGVVSIGPQDLRAGLTFGARSFPVTNIRLLTCVDRNTSLNDRPIKAEKVLGRRLAGFTISCGTGGWKDQVTKHW